MTVLAVVGLVVVPLLAMAAGRFRPALAGAAGWVAVAAAVLGLAVVTPGAVATVGGVAVGFSSLGRGALWLSVFGLGLVMVLAPRGAARTDALALHLAAVALVGVRHPLLLLLAIALLAAGLERLTPTATSARWPRLLVLAGAAWSVLGALEAAGPALLGERAAALLLLLSLASLAGAGPAAVALARWLEEAPPALAAATVSSLCPALLVVAAAGYADLGGLRQGARPAWALAGLGIATVLAGGLGGLLATTRRGLAARGAIADVGVAVVGLASLEINGLEGAGLALLVLAVARPLQLLTAELPRPRADPVRWVTGLAGAGLPPTAGFAARLLVLGAAFRVGNPFGAALVVALLVDAAASLRGLAVSHAPSARGSGAEPAGAAEAAGAGTVAPAFAGGGPARQLAASLAAAVLLVAGIYPGRALAMVFGLG